MVSWGYAFKRGGIIWLWTIVWGIIGSVIALLISGGSLLLLISDPSSTTLAGSIIGIVVGIIVGALITSIGNYAAIVKITLDSIEETKKQL